MILIDGNRRPVNHERLRCCECKSDVRKESDGFHCDCGRIEDGHEVEHRPAFPMAMTTKIGFG